MFKKILIVFFFLSFFLLSLKQVYGQSQFLTDVYTQYEISESGRTRVINTITIQNATSQWEASSYILNLTGIVPMGAHAYSESKPLKLTEEKQDGTTKLQVTFDEPVPGLGRTREFVIEYENEEFAVRSGEVWEISIPRLDNENAFSSYKASIIIPKSFGKEAYVAPHPKQIEKSEDRLFYFFGNEAAKTGISAGFGEFQVFSFALNYHLENPIGRLAETEIALPPDTSLQKVYYQDIVPAPIKVVADEDGNWLAKYTLGPKERIDVTLTGSVQIFASPRELPSKISEFYTKPTKYWESSDPKIQEIAFKLKTPQEIYNFVTTSLSYDYGRVKPNVERLGAKGALESPSSAICMEFTDLFIALARAAKIPAREINGYAYTENPKIQPLSLVADVLHSWPEYFDDEKKVWVPIDPTWGATGGGVDYFNKLDLRHFAFVIHGANDSKPYPPGSYKLGPNPQKDVFVSFGLMPKTKRGKIEISASDGGISLLEKKVDIKIKNSGVSALYGTNYQIYFDQENVGSGSIDVLPPYGEYQTGVTVPYGILGFKSPSQIKIVADSSQMTFPTNKSRFIFYQLMVLSFILVIAVLGVFLKTGKIRGVNIFKTYGDKPPKEK